MGNIKYYALPLIMPMHSSAAGRFLKIYYCSILQVVRMRANLLCGRGGVSQLIDEDTRHSLPIGQMGNYQDYLKKQPMPLRELECAPVRQHMFGNPFKTNKNLMMMTDEVSGLGGVDEVQIVTPGTPQSLQQRGLKRPAEQVLSAPPKRRKGPLAKDFQFSSPASSPVHSPPYLAPVPDEPSHVPYIEPYSAPVSVPLLPLPPAPVLNGIKPNYPAGKMAYFFKDEEDKLEDSLTIIEEVKPLVELEPPSLHVPPEPTSNHISKNNNKHELTRNETSKPVLDPILSNLDLVQDPILKAWHSNGQVEHVSVYRKQQPDIFQSFHKEQAEMKTVKSVEERVGMKIKEKINIPVVDIPESPKSAPSLEDEPTEEELRSIKLRNNNVRQLIYKEVKRPGKCHNVLWKMLEGLYGPPWIRKQFILEVKQEAVR